MAHSSRFLRLVEAARRGVREVDANQVRRLQEAGDPFHLIDVREESEWARGRLPGAVHLGRGVLERDVEDHLPDEDAAIVVYCAGGYRSVLAAESLQRMGYANVASLAGGVRGWTEAGNPLV